VGIRCLGNRLPAPTPSLSVIGYRIPTSLLKTRLPQDPALEFQVICKLCHELHESQRHALLLSTHRALPKIAGFILMLESHRVAMGEPADEIDLLMTQGDIGDYVGSCRRRR
jgi:CRP-like cAMP-binding protein